MSSESLADRLEAWLVPAPTNDTEKQQERTALHVIAVVEAAAALRAQQKREQDLHDCLHLVGMERDTALSRIASRIAELARDKQATIESLQAENSEYREVNAKLRALNLKATGTGERMPADIEALMRELTETRDARDQHAERCGELLNKNAELVAVVEALEHQNGAPE